MSVLEMGKKWRGEQGRRVPLAAYNECSNSVGGFVFLLGTVGERRWTCRYWYLNYINMPHREKR